MKLLVITNPDFQDVEMIGFLGTLNETLKIDNITFLTTSNNKSLEIQGSNKLGFIKVEKDVDLNDFDALFVPGGKACVAMRQDKKVYEVIDHFEKSNKYIFAICDAPNVIFEMGLLKDKCYTSYPIDNIETKSSKHRYSDKDVVVDGKYITGKGPLATQLFALEVIKELFGQNEYERVLNKISGKR